MSKLAAFVTLAVCALLEAGGGSDVGVAGAGGAMLVPSALMLRRRTSSTVMSGRPS